jgi:hypothetical protein
MATPSVEEVRDATAAVTYDDVVAAAFPRR